MEIDRKQRVIDVGLGALFGASATFLFVGLIIGSPLPTLLGSLFATLAIGLSLAARWQLWGKEIDDNATRDQQQGIS